MIGFLVLGVWLGVGFLLGVAQARVARRRLNWRGTPKYSESEIFGWFMLGFLWPIIISVIMFWTIEWPPTRSKNHKPNPIWGALCRIAKWLTTSPRDRKAKA